MANSPSLFICHPGTLGDALLSLQAIRALKANLEPHDCLFLGRKEIGHFFEACGVIKRHWSLEGPVYNDLIYQPDSLSPEVRSVLCQCTHGVVWMNAKYSEVKGALLRLGMKQLIVHSPKESNLTACHWEDRFLETLHPWNIHRSTDRWPLRLRPAYVTDTRRKVGREPEILTCQNLVVIHPGSGSRHKCCAASFLGQLVRNLVRQWDVKLLICGGPADHSILHDFEQELEGINYSSVIGRDLVSMARLFMSVTLYIGHDSGLTHLAAAMGVNTIVLFGPTDPNRWAPRGKRVRILRGAHCECSNWKEVQECSNKPCLQFRIETILDVVEEFLADGKCDKNVIPGAFPA